MKLEVREMSKGAIEVYDRVWVPRWVHLGDDTDDGLEIQAWIKNGKMRITKIEHDDGLEPLIAREITFANTIYDMAPGLIYDNPSMSTRALFPTGPTGPFLHGWASTLDRVAAAYRIGAVFNFPTRRVHECLEVARPTAGRWVMRARIAGLIPPAHREGPQ